MNELINLLTKIMQRSPFGGSLMCCKLEHHVFKIGKIYLFGTGHFLQIKATYFDRRKWHKRFPLESQRNVIIDFIHFRFLSYFYLIQAAWVGFILKKCNLLNHPLINMSLFFFN